MTPIEAVGLYWAFRLRSIDVRTRTDARTLAIALASTLPEDATTTPILRWVDDRPRTSQIMGDPPDRLIDRSLRTLVTEGFLLPIPPFDTARAYYVNLTNPPR